MRNSWRDIWTFWFNVIFATSIQIQLLFFGLIIAYYCIRKRFSRLNVASFFVAFYYFFTIPVLELQQLQKERLQPFQRKYKLAKQVPESKILPT